MGGDADTPQTDTPPPGWQCCREGQRRVAQRRRREMIIGAPHPEEIRRMRNLVPPVSHSACGRKGRGLWRRVDTWLKGRSSTKSGSWAQGEGFVGDTRGVDIAMCFAATGRLAKPCKASCAKRLKRPESHIHSTDHEDQDGTGGGGAWLVAWRWRSRSSSRTTIRFEKVIIITSAIRRESFIPSHRALVPLEKTSGCPDAGCNWSLCEVVQSASTGSGR